MECSTLLKILGERIRAIRKARGISQEKLAELASLHPVFISKIETGKAKASLCSYNSIAKALEISLAELVELPGDKGDSDMVALFQAAKMLDEDKRTIFVETVRGVLSGLGCL